MRRRTKRYVIERKRKDPETVLRNFLGGKKKRRQGGVRTWSPSDGIRIRVWGGLLKKKETAELMGKYFFGGKNWVLESVPERKERGEKRNCEKTQRKEIDKKTKETNEDHGIHKEKGKIENGEGKASRGFLKKKKTSNIRKSVPSQKREKKGDKRPARSKGKSKCNGWLPLCKSRFSEARRHDLENKWPRGEKVVFQGAARESGGETGGKKKKESGESGKPQRKGVSPWTERRPPKKGKRGNTKKKEKKKKPAERGKKSSRGLKSGGKHQAERENPSTKKGGREKV